MRGKKTSRKINLDLRVVIRRGLHLLPYFFAILTLIFLIWSVYFLFNYPDDGLVIYFKTNEVIDVDPFGPTAGFIEPGDFIIRSQDRGSVLRVPPYLDNPDNSRHKIHFYHDGKRVDQEFTLIPPQNNELYDRLMPLAVAFIFWIIGLIVVSYQHRDLTTILFFTNAQVGCIVLISGELSRYDFPIMDILFKLVFLSIGPLSVHFHQKFPRIYIGKKYQLIQYGLYLVATVCAISIIYLMVFRADKNSIIEELNLIANLILIASWVYVVWLLINTYNRSSIQNDRGIIRLVSFGGILGFFPFILFSFFHVFFEDNFPYLVTSGLPFLGMIPLIYGYSIIRHRLLPIENRVSRPATQILVVLLTIGFFFLVFYMLTIFIPKYILENSFLMTFIVFILGSSFWRVKLIIRRILDRIFYGGWYDYKLMMVLSSKELVNTYDQKRLSEQALNFLKTMHFDSGVIYLSRGNILAPQACFGIKDDLTKIPNLPNSGKIAEYLSNHPEPSWREDILGSINYEEIFLEEKQVLELESSKLYLPLISRNNLQGMLILRSQYSKEWMSQEDLDILRTLAALVAIASENVSLLQELRTQLTILERARADLAESRKSLAEGREQERLHLARELHDGPIQDLYAVCLNFGNPGAAENANSSGDLNAKILAVIHELRDLCTQLRPPSLAYFGFEPAVQTLVKKFSSEHPDIEVNLSVLETGPGLNDSQKIAFYRILQEALRNIGQHASASEISIRYRKDGDFVTLEVTDNGIGFSVPGRWVELSRRGHLGLLGIAERAESFGGSLTIQSRLGKGTVLQVTIPIEEFNENHKVSYFLTAKEIR